jgi:WhiB family redox-sensing transcriptional regulator
VLSTVLERYDQSVAVGLFTGRWNYPDWYHDGKCVNLPLAMFFGEENETDTQLIGPGVLHRAQKICGSCPVRAQCLEYALDKHILHGIWSGTSGRTRARIWAMERRGEVTRAQVLVDFACGRGQRYEKLPPRHHREDGKMSYSISR